jgi:hypothetical protein
MAAPTLDAPIHPARRVELGARTPRLPIAERGIDFAK